MLSNARNGRYLRTGPSGKKFTALVIADESSRLRCLAGGNAFSTEEEAADERRRVLLQQSNQRLLLQKRQGQGMEESAQHRAEVLEKQIADNRATIDKLLDEYQRGAHDPEKRRKLSITVSRLIKNSEESIRRNDLLATSTSMSRSYKNQHLGGGGGGATSAGSFGEDTSGGGAGEYGGGTQDASMTMGGSVRRKGGRKKSVCGLPLDTADPHALRKEAILERLRARILTQAEEVVAVSCYYQCIAEGKDVSQQVYAIFAEMGLGQLPNTTECADLLELIQDRSIVSVGEGGGAVQTTTLNLPEFLIMVDAWKRYTLYGEELIPLDINALNQSASEHTTAAHPVSPGGSAAAALSLSDGPEAALLSAFMGVSAHAGTEEDPHVVEDLVAFANKFKMRPDALFAITSAPDAAGIAVPASGTNGFALLPGDADNDHHLQCALHTYASPSTTSTNPLAIMPPSPQSQGAAAEESVSPITLRQRRLSDAFYKDVAVGDGPAPRHGSLANTATASSLAAALETTGRAFSLSVRMANRLVAIFNKERVQNFRPGAHTYLIVDAIVGDNDPSVVRAKGRQARLTTQEQRQQNVLTVGGAALKAVVMSHLVSTKTTEAAHRKKPSYSAFNNAPTSSPESEEEDDVDAAAVGSRAEAQLQAKRERLRHEAIVKDAEEDFKYMQDAEIERIVRQTRFITNSELLCVLGAGPTMASSSGSSSATASHSCPNTTALLEEFILLGASDPTLPDSILSDLRSGVVMEGVPASIITRSTDATSTYEDGDDTTPAGQRQHSPPVNNPIHKDAASVSAVRRAAHAMSEASTLGSEWYRSLEIPLGALIVSPHLSHVFTELHRRGGTHIWGSDASSSAPAVPAAPKALKGGSTAELSPSPGRTKTATFDLPSQSHTNKSISDAAALKRSSDSSSAVIATTTPATKGLDDDGVDDTMYNIDDEDVQMFLLDYLKTLLLDVQGPSAFRGVYRRDSGRSARQNQQDDTTTTNHIDGPNNQSSTVHHVDGVESAMSNSPVDRSSPGPPTQAIMEVHNESMRGFGESASLSLGGAGFTNNFTSDEKERRASGCTVSSHVAGRVGSDLDGGENLSISDDDSEAAREERQRARELLRVLNLPIPFDTYCQMVELHNINLDHLAVHMPPSTSSLSGDPRKGRAHLRELAIQGALLGGELDEELEGWGDVLPANQNEGTSPAGAGMSVGTGSPNPHSFNSSHGSPPPDSILRAQNSSMWVASPSPEGGLMGSPYAPHLGGSSNPDRGKLPPTFDESVDIHEKSPAPAAQYDGTKWEASVFSSPPPPEIGAQSFIGRASSMRARGQSMRSSGVDGGGVGGKSFAGSSRYGGRNHMKGTYESLRLMDAVRKTTAPPNQTVTAFREHEDTCEPGYFDDPVREVIKIKYRGGGTLPSQQQQHERRGRVPPGTRPNSSSTAHSPPFRFKGLRKTILDEPRLVDDGSPATCMPGVRMRSANSALRVAANTTASHPPTPHLMGVSPVPPRDPAVPGEHDDDEELSFLATPGSVRREVSSDNENSRLRRTETAPATPRNNSIPLPPQTARHPAPPPSTLSSTPRTPNHHPKKPTVSSTSKVDDSHQSPRSFAGNRLSYRGESNRTSEPSLSRPTPTPASPQGHTNTIIKGNPRSCLRSSSSGGQRHNSVVMGGLSPLQADPEYAERHGGNTASSHPSPQGIHHHHSNRPHATVIETAAHFLSPSPRPPTYTHEHQIDQRHSPDFHNNSMDRYAKMMRANRTR